MATASVLSVVLFYLVGLRQADRRQNKVSREVQQYKEVTVCSLFDL